MVDLGVGKNMVRAIKFWMQAAEIAKSTKGGYKRTTFAEQVLGKHDRYLEDIRTLWLLHWRISTNAEEPLFAWEFMLNHWQDPEFSRKQVLDVFKREGAKQAKPPSDVTLEHHWETFLHTYYPTRGRKNEIQEDNLDCPLVELELIQKVGERTVDGGKREDVYVFNKAPKPEITPRLLVYCLNEFWNRRVTGKTLTFREASTGIASVGQIFKLPELDLRERFEDIEEDSRGLFVFHESAAQPTLERTTKRNEEELLKSIYELEAANV